MEQRSRQGRAALGAALATALAASAVVVGTGAASAGSGAASAGSGEGAPVLRVRDWVGVPLAYTGDRAPIRARNGGGLPWSLERADVRLSADGAVRVDVRGLVLADEAPVPVERRGVNPAPAFGVVLSCQTVVAGAATVQDLVSPTFPATPTGDARATVQLGELPEPCLAPVVFLTGANGAWFAVGAVDG